MCSDYVMILYCALKTYEEQNRQEMENKVAELAISDNFLSSVDEAGYFTSENLPEYIESLKILNDSTKDIRVFLFQWVVEEDISSTELFSIQSLPTKKWKNSWSSLCISDSVKNSCLDYISSIIQISRSNIDSSLLSLNR